jgi:hypothetical protein
LASTAIASASIVDEVQISDLLDMAVGILYPSNRGLNVAYENQEDRANYDQGRKVHLVDVSDYERAQSSRRPSN